MRLIISILLTFNGILVAQSMNSANVLKSKWEVSIGYGVLQFIDNATLKSDDDYVKFPDQMSILSSSLTKHFLENYSANIYVGVQINKNLPPNPNIFSVLAGDDIRIEGSGGGFFPMGIGIKRYLLQSKLRPYIQLQGGIVMGNSQYTLAEGNIFDGVIRTDHKSESNVMHGIISTGFDYNLMKKYNINLNIGYNHSGDFKQRIGGYNNYNGLQLNTSFSIIFK